jgi:hypothetical protein
MKDHQELTTKTIIDGRPYTVTFIHNPTIEDVVVSEMKLAAAEVMGLTTSDDRRVGRAIRDFLIRLGVDR